MTDAEPGRDANAASSSPPEVPAKPPRPFEPPPPQPGGTQVFTEAAHPTVREGELGGQEHEGQRGLPQRPPTKAR